jgi:hypothetical protein
MNKILIPILTLTVMTAACLPVATPPAPASQVDTQATIDSIVNTAVALTQAAQPTSTTAPIIETATPSSTPPPTDITVTLETTLVPNLTTTPATATSGAEDPSTSTPTAGSSGVITLTPTLGVLTYGTLPPAVPSSPVTLVNKSKAQAYISLQLCDTVAAGAILEYPVQSTVKIKAPLGNYIYVVWVGGRQLTGTLKVNSGTELKITIYKDKVTVQ